MTDSIQQKLNKRHATRRKAAIRRQKALSKYRLKTLQVHKTDKDIIDYMEFRGERRRGI